MATATDEMVLCVPATALDALGRFQGFRESNERQWSALVGDASWRPRGAVEDDPAWKQCIAYVSLWRGGDVLWYRRAKAGGEGRLHGRASLGIGGHVNPGRDTFESRPTRATALFSIIGTGFREVLEESGLTAGRGRWGAAGLVNDDSDAVGRVHLGFCYRVQLDLSAPPLNFAPEIEPLGFHPVAEPPVPPEEMESWSRLWWDAIRGS